jgi:hypothetical protein
LQNGKSDRILSGGSSAEQQRRQTPFVQRRIRPLKPGSSEAQRRGFFGASYRRLRRRIIIAAEKTASLAY